MKKIVIAGIIAVFAACLPVVANAADKTLGFALNLSYPQISISDTRVRPLDLGALGTYSVWYTGSASLSPTDTNAILNGLNAGKIWSYEYSADGTNWTVFDTLIDTFSATANSVGKSVNDSKMQTVQARWLRLGYNVRLDSLDDANVSGSASLTATAVPEPSSILCLAGMLTSVGLLRRRKL